MIITRRVNNSYTHITSDTSDEPQSQSHIPPWMRRASRYPHLANRTPSRSTPTSQLLGFHSSMSSRLQCVLLSSLNEHPNRHVDIIVSSPTTRTAAPGHGKAGRSLPFASLPFLPMDQGGTHLTLIGMAGTSWCQSWPCTTRASHIARKGQLLDD